MEDAGLERGGPGHHQERLHTAPCALFSIRRGPLSSPSGLGWGMTGAGQKSGMLGEGRGNQSNENGVVPGVFEDFPDVLRILAFVGVDNKASQRVLEKAGFTRAGLLRKYACLKGTLQGLCLYSFLSTGVVPADRILLGTGKLTNANGPSQDPGYHGMGTANQESMASGGSNRVNHQTHRRLYVQDTKIYVVGRVQRKYQALRPA